MNKAKYQKMYTEKYKQDMDFVIIGDYYIGPFIDMDVAQKAASAINKQFAPKPKRTRTEYEKVTESIFDLRDEFERGELYIYRQGDYHKVENEQELMGFGCTGDLLRRTKNQVDWRDDVKSCLKSACTENDDEFDGFIVTHTSWLFSFNPTDDEFLELCRVALRARGEL